MAMLKHPIKEAERYMKNARHILSEKGEKSGNFYGDKKYVKLAGHAAWNGILIALDAVTDVRKNLKKGQRLDYKDYQKALAAKSPKMNKTLDAAYDLLHKSMGYDGILSYKVVQEGLNLGDEVLEWAEKNYN